ncbi:hypothetical protein [Nostoc sp. FACHB-110]|uniref:hypothetical protein n=1 Tax=Nostoc sp. FACHB-110 TaxID=2692834 RepID=UPI0019ACE4F9|nr:hypothetical protein [Nostoc sp. FACHB-110]MBD2436281.1 hypothetical protein [Nostoc sp. FACHB-110]
MQLMVGILSLFVQAIAPIFLGMLVTVKSNHSNYTYIDTYIIMPNHVHGIIIDQPKQINEDTPSHNLETLQCNVSLLRTKL